MVFSLLKLFVLLCVYQVAHSADPLKVSIYYESLCPDSVRFITRQLYPAYQKIGTSLLVDFVPYGKASHVNENGKWSFQCQHGPRECWGNKAQACGIAEEKGQDQTVEFVNCVMGSINPASEATIIKCASKLDVAGQQLIDCAGSSKGDDLHAKHGDKTHSLEPSVSFVPTIVFNDKYDDDNQDGALRNFLSTACRLLEEKPSGCSSSSSSVRA